MDFTIANVYYQGKIRMKKQIQSLFFVMLLVPAVFASQSSQAMSLKALPLRMAALVKTLFSPARMKNTMQRGAQALWTAAKLGGVATVLGNILLPLELRRRLANKSFIGRFIFNVNAKRGNNLVENIDDDRLRILTERTTALEGSIGRLQDQIDRLSTNLGRLQHRLDDVESARIVLSGSPSVK